MSHSARTEKLVNTYVHRLLMYMCKLIKYSVVVVQCTVLLFCVLNIVHRTELTFVSDVLYLQFFALSQKASVFDSDDSSLDIS